MQLSRLFSERLQQVQNSDWGHSITGIRRGIERETLKITPQRRLSLQDHPPALGSALTHPLITTDFSESLLEFITPAELSIETTLSQLDDIHRFAIRQLGDEVLGHTHRP